MNINLISQKINSFLERKNVKVFIILVFVIGAVVIIGAYRDEGLVKNPENCPAIAQGEQIYNIPTDDQKNPQIKQVIFNPLDVEPGETQTITVKVLNPNSNTVTYKNKTSVVYHTDNKSIPVSLSMKRIDNVDDSIEIDPNGEDLLITWQGDWINNDTNCASYMASVIASNIFDRSTVDISFR